ncbi:MAG: hypothetical protein HOI47_03280 [Candidatus Scalindua sp.]|nr:hypothetical protein [Candidatus Scalindua sp.]
MIKNSFLKKQIENAQKEKKTPKFLRRLTFFVVDRVLKCHYSDTFPEKCFQSSLAINMVLRRFEIRSEAFVGAVCVAQVFEEENRFPSWNGFWGEDHHIWSCTEFGEFVDLTIRYLHLHPDTKDNKQLPMPALWWEDTIDWPRVIKYLHQDQRPVKPGFSDDEMRDLEIFKQLILTELDTVLDTCSVQEIEFHPILHGINSMNELHAKGDPWLCKSIMFQDLNLPYPTWIKEREAELMRNYAAET